MRLLTITALTAAVLAAPAAFAAEPQDPGADPTEKFEQSASPTNAGEAVANSPDETTTHSGDPSRDLFNEDAPGSTREFSEDETIPSTADAPGAVPGYIFVRADMNNDGMLNPTEKEEAKRLMRLEREEG